MDRSATPSPADDADRRRRQSFVMLGLFLSFVGLLLVGGILPTAPGPLGHVLPLLAAGLLVFWLGGLLLGNSGRPLWRRRAPR